MRKVAAFCIADNKNLPLYEKMKASLRKFHSEQELPLFLIGEKEIEEYKDPQFFYRATPLVAEKLLKEYETVIKIDADSLILGDISHVWTAKNFDVGVVNNSNPVDHEKYPVQLWNIHPYSYVNCGFVVMRSHQFVEQWKALCLSGHFNSYQFKEQDLLNIMVFYMNSDLKGPYRVNFLDSGDKWHGLIYKGYESKVLLKKEYVQVNDENGKLKFTDGKITVRTQPSHLFLPPQEGWNQNEQQIVIWHAAGGDDPNKGNYQLKFSEEVSDYIDTLVS